MKSLRIIEWDHHDGGQTIKNITEMKLSNIFRKTCMSNGFRRVFADLVDKADDCDIHITLSIVDYEKGETK